MNQVNSSVALTIFLFIVYLLSYVAARRKLNKGGRVWSWAFFLNFAYLIYLTTFYQSSFFRKLGIESRFFDFTIAMMTFGAVLHHLSIILERKFNHRAIKLAHAQISHLLFSIPMGLNSLIVSVALWKNISGFTNISLTISFTLACLSYSTVVFLAGFQKVKLPY